MLTYLLDNTLVQPLKSTSTKVVLNYNLLTRN